jgi:hypothetical protein
MKFKHYVVSLTLLVAALSASAQSMPTATQKLQLSAFAGGSGVLTNLLGGKNLSFTAGVDLAYLGFRLFKPAIEVRGSYPVYDGHIDSQKSILAGPKVEFPLGRRLHPYADFLIGRGEIDYNQGLFIVGPVEYISTNTTVYSPGAGIDYDLFYGFALKGDAQFQHWDTPVVTSGVIHPTVVTLGVNYNFNFNPRGYRH